MFLILMTASSFKITLCEMQVLNVAPDYNEDLKQKSQNAPSKIDAVPKGGYETWKDGTGIYYSNVRWDTLKFSCSNVAF